MEEHASTSDAPIRVRGSHDRLLTFPSFQPPSIRNDVIASLLANTATKVSG
jgi:hypothetical protein